MMHLFLFACSVLVVVPLYFVVHRVYSDGVFGRIGLLGVSFSASTYLIEWFDGDEYIVFPQTVLLTCSFAVFLVWHLVRFHRRVVCRREPRHESRHELV